MFKMIKMSNLSKMFIFLLLIALIVFCDQYSKRLIQEQMIYGESWVVIPGLLNITFVQNSGAAFGMGANALLLWRQILFLLLPVGACLWLLYLVWSACEKGWLQATAYSLILAGAIGNLVDRFILGYVVDFIDFYCGAYHFWTFNVADSSISVAAGLLIFEFIREWKKSRKEQLIGHGK